MTQSRKARKVGRPPAGVDGARSSQYSQLAVRVPAETIRQCAALASKMNIPRWKVVRYAIDAYFRAARRQRTTGE